MMNGVTEFDICSPNFDLYLHNKLVKLTPDQRSGVDKRLARKVFRGKVVRVDKLNFSEKAYLLGSLFNKEVLTVIVGDDDDEELVSPKVFLEAAAVLKGKQGAMAKLAQEMLEGDYFVVASSELYNSFMMQSLFCVTDLYRHAIPIRERRITPQKDVVEFDAAIKWFIGNFLAHYEGNKKMMDLSFGITPSEWYALLHFSMGENTGPSFYEDKFLNATSANQITKMKCLGRLSRDGYLDSRGRTHRKRYRLSMKGRETLHKIMTTIVFKH